jgi:lipoprotein-anchoring transpeptidase ErfK/SrfK
LSYLLIVKRAVFELEVWKKRLLPPREYRLVTSVRIGIGAKGFDTPAGVYWVLARAKNPDWLMPNSDWVAPEDRGRTIKGGDPANPIKAAFLKLTEDGVGIHGTGDLDSLGTKASHGCIRLHPSVALDLHRRVRKGTPVVVL